MKILQKQVAERTQAGSSSAPKYPALHPDPEKLKPGGRQAGRNAGRQAGTQAGSPAGRTRQAGNL